LATAISLPGADVIENGAAPGEEKMIVRNASALAAMALALTIARAQAVTTRSCDSLAGLDLSKVADRPAHVVSAKLFLIPGLYHCEGGEGFTKTDILTPLIAWVEEGKAPSELVLAGDNGTRPVFPYPAVAEYSGTGERMSLASWRAVIPAAEPALRPWIGEAFLTPERK
jgi:Tannase and feruloyl esterase